MTNLDEALGNFPSNHSFQLYERQINDLRNQLARLSSENTALKTRMAMQEQPKAEIGQIKTEPRELNVSINIQF